jgi:UDPglucose 6-dehydrogenase
MKNNACVIGYGIVGQATAEALGIEKHFDIQEDRSNITLEEAANCRLVFICLPTPIDKDGNYLLDDITKIIRQINDYGNGNIFVIRSTVYPGYAVYLQSELMINCILSNPEFLSEKTALEDTKNPPFIIIGGFEGVYREELQAFYAARIKGADVIMTDNTTAEMSKLALNAYFATKVIFANQLFDACKKQPQGANYQTIKKIFEKHPFGPKNHFKIWFNGARGVNGHCLPKDTKAFENYTRLPLIGLVNELNKTYIYQKEDDL